MVKFVAPERFIAGNEKPTLLSVLVHAAFSFSTPQGISDFTFSELPTCALPLNTSEVTVLKFHQSVCMSICH